MASPVASQQPVETLVLETPAQSETAQSAQVEEPQAGPECTPPASLTPPMTEGPYYKSGSPERTSLLEAGIPGTPLTLTGYVLSADCQPIAGAWLDFWQTDGNGAYDNAGYKLRGHQFTDEQGHYQLETVVPGIYPGRTAHIHVKVQVPGGSVLTSQLFFPGVVENDTDSIFDPQLVVVIEKTGEEFLGTFNFVVGQD
jgi:protocatechuate 3,4-dioxygenase beta subunit